MIRSSSLGCMREITEEDAADAEPLQGDDVLSCGVDRPLAAPLDALVLADPDFCARATGEVPVELVRLRDGRVRTLSARDWCGFVSTDKTDVRLPSLNAPRTKG